MPTTRSNRGRIRASHRNVRRPGLFLGLACIAVLSAAPTFADTHEAAPARAAALMAEATAAFDAFELDKAGQLFDALEQQSGRSATLLYYRVRMLALRNQAGPALKLAQQCVDQYPTASRCHEALGDARITAALASGKMMDILAGAKSAKDSWEKELELDPANANATLVLLQYYRQAPWPVGSTSRAQELERQITAHKTPTT